MANTLKNKLRISINNHNTIIHIIKFTLAFLIGWAVTYLFPQSRSQWIMISIAVVMGSSSVIGLQMNKALLRAAGTLLGGSLGLITFLSPGNSMLFFIMLCFTASFFAWFSRKFEKKNYHHHQQHPSVRGAAVGGPVSSPSVVSSRHIHKNFL